MRSDRRSQPYRRGARAPSLALTAMLKGRSAGGMNAADGTRAVQRLIAAGKTRKRPTRPKRPARPPR